MSEQKDIRWLQRFDNYKRALERLEEAVELGKKSTLLNIAQDRGA